MIKFNLDVRPDENATTTYPGGDYNFTCITADENAEILSLLRAAQSYPESQRGIALACFSEGTVHKQRYIIDQIIVEYAKFSTYPLDKLAEFIAYSRKSSEFRSKAIKAFEEYNSLPAHEAVPLSPYGSQMYSFGRLYLIAAELYEKEYAFGKAINAIDISAQMGCNIVVCTERKAEILAKVDINQAVAYLESAICSDPQLALLSSKLQEYKDKADKCYKFKPRKKSAQNDDTKKYQVRQLAYRYLAK